MPNLRFIGAVSTALRFNEIEILTWCFGVYLFLIEDKIFFRQLITRIKPGEKVYLKWRRADELVISCAIFAKVLNCGTFETLDEDCKVDADTERLMKALNLDKELLCKMFNQIRIFLDDPIRIHAVWKVISRNLNGSKSMLKCEAYDYNDTVD